MGMAAGQARLLSITSRMSDNELRAQLINNDKMRLATKSAQVSEAYTTALNEAQLMFTNYDKDNNSSYKELTFNSLTAYNQYNNQYAISNAAGQLLVSETDAKNFQKSKDINEFLAYYGLKQSTTFFSDTLKKSEGVNYYALQGNNAVLTDSKSQGVVYNSDSIYTDKNGISKTIQIDSGWKADRLKAMYEGGEYTFADGTKENYAGYMTTKASPDFYEYKNLVTQYNNKKLAYQESIKNQISDLFKKDTFGLNKLLNKIGTYGQTPTLNNAKEAINELVAIIGYGSTANTTSFKSYTLGVDGAEDYYKAQIDTLETLKTGNETVHYGTENLKWTPVANSNSGTLTYDVSDEDSGPNKDCFKLNYDGTSWSGTFDYYTEETDAKGETKTIKNSSPLEIINNANNKITFKLNVNGKTYSFPDPNVAGNYDADKNQFTSGKTIDVIAPVDPASILEKVTQMIDNLQQTFINYVSRDKFNTSEEYKNYQNAAKELYKFIYGTKPTDNLDSNILENITDVNWVTGPNEEAEAGKPGFVDEASKQRYAKIKQAIVLDYIMDTYGEPKYDWIDENDKNGNGSAKAQWYENLYHKMKSSGYKALQDGLASSTEWIKFAFESGLVCLEQVDTNKNWHATTYTNCSDITEQTNNAALTKAEAEYNAAMAKIENKDKRYDLELKNIDTEHNSLQTEYDSIKTAIDKNIERTFKIYS